MTTLLAVGAIVVSVLIVREARNATDRLRLIGFIARARRRARQPLGSDLPVARVPSRPRRRLRRGRPLPRVQRRGLVHHDRGDHPRVGHVARVVRDVTEHRTDRGPGRARRGARRPRRCPAHRLEPRRRAGAHRGRRCPRRRPRRSGRAGACTQARSSKCSAEPVPAGPPLAEPECRSDVRYDDDDVIVVAKPAGLVVHPGAGHDSGTLVTRLARAVSRRSRSVGDPFRPGIVHRLDRDTSGLMVVARIDRVRTRRWSSSCRAGRSTVATRRSCGGVSTRRAARSTRPSVARSSRRTRMASATPAGPARTGYEVVARVRRSPVQPARVHARDRPHASDPRASRRRRPSGRRRRDVRRPTRARSTSTRLFLHAAHLAFDASRDGTATYEEPLPPEFADARCSSE